MVPRSTQYLFLPLKINRQIIRSNIVIEDRVHFKNNMFQDMNYLCTVKLYY